MQHLQSKFEAYHQAHPGIYQRFKDLALRLIEQGKTHYGAKTIMEVIRYHTDADSRPGSKFKIDNSFSAYYARKFADDHPEHKHFFSMRQLKAA